MGIKAFRFLVLCGGIWAGILTGPTPAKADSFDLEDLSKIVRNPHVKSVDDVLEKLPRSLFKNFVLVRTSQSMQTSTEKSPRVILWNEDSGFVMAFNGHSQEAGFNTIETLQFEKDKASLKFAEVEFTGGHGEVSRPEVCASCHGFSPRPIWQQYPFWPSAFGSLDDELKDTERTPFLDFKTKFKDNSRYKHLAPVMDAYELAPYRVHVNATGQSLDNTLLRRPNLRFNIFLNRINASRLAKNLETNLNFSDLKSLTRSILNCPETLPVTQAMAKSLQYLEDWDMRASILDTNAYASAQWDRPYFDGSATIMELVGAKLVEFLSKKNVLEFDPEKILWSLDRKYDSTLDHYAEQRPIVHALDKIGRWVPIPFVMDDEFQRIKRVPLIAGQKLRWKRACKALE